MSDWSDIDAELLTEGLGHLTHCAIELKDNGVPLPVDFAKEAASKTHRLAMIGFDGDDEDPLSVAFGMLGGIVLMLAMDDNNEAATIERLTAIIMKAQER